jgi:hypothetical protein
MKHHALTALVLALLVLVAFGCDREISGDVQVVDAASVSCFECHSDQDQSLTVAREQYEESVHFEGENVNRNRFYSSRYASCEKCHTNEGFIADVTGTEWSGEGFTQVDCFTCHAPHSTGNLELRVIEAVDLANGFTFNRGSANLCATCHQSRRDVTVTVVDAVELSSHWGPHHSNQADMLIGENSYEYEGFPYQKSAHSLAPEGCNHCHMGPSIHPTVGGHSWNMRNEDRGFQHTAGCNVDACHNGAISTLDITAEGDFDFDGEVEGIQSEIHGLLDSLEILLEDASLLLDGHPISDRVVSTADSAGALYNWLFVEEDRSLGVHNTDYAVGLLQSSINFLNTGDPNGSGSVNRVDLPGSNETEARTVRFGVVPSH